MTKKKPVPSPTSKVPSFKNEEEEFHFWLTHGSEKFVDWSKAKRVVFANLKPSSKSISLRLPVDLLNQYKIQANKRDIPYQALIKMILAEGIKRV